MIKKILGIAMIFTMLLSLNSITLANEIETEDNNLKLISETTTWINNFTKKEVKIYQTIDGDTITDITETIYKQNPFIRAKSGSATKNNSKEIYDRNGNLGVTMKVSADFSWNGTTCTVSNDKYTYSVYNQCRKEKWDADSSDSGTFNKAYAKVNYKFVNWNGTSIGSGKLEVTCSKNGD